MKWDFPNSPYWEYTQAMEALQQALRAITIAQKFANKAVQEWINQQKASGRWNQR